MQDPKTSRRETSGHLLLRTTSIVSLVMASILPVVSAADNHEAPMRPGSPDCPILAGEELMNDAPPTVNRNYRDPCWQSQIRVFDLDPDVNLQARNIHQVDEAAERHGVSGADVRVGVWDGGLIFAKHREFSRRVRIDDPKAVGNCSQDIKLSSHATHVAGTIGAHGGEGGFKGERRAKGMAENVMISSYDWHDDIVELRTARQAGGADDRISISNHSYGPRAGWTVNVKNGCGTGWQWFGRASDVGRSHIFGWYGQNERDIDALIHEDPGISVFVAAGNDRGGAVNPLDTNPNFFQSNEYCVADFQAMAWAKSSQPRPSDLGNQGGYDTLGGLSVAKNVISVGAMVDIESSEQVDREAIASTNFASWGPTDDGRIKPDVIANGQELLSTAPPTFCEFGSCCRATIQANQATYVSKSGTSMASPVAAGIGSLLNEIVMIDNPWGEETSRPLRGDEMKAVLIHTSNSLLESRAPTYSMGWGAINALAAANLLGDNSESVQLITVAADKAWSRKVKWPDPAPDHDEVPARVTLAWIDRPGQASDVQTTTADDPAARLVNDLNLVVTAPNGEQFHPWSLNPQNPTAPATNTGANRVDNVEVVDLPLAAREADGNADGDWTIQVRLAKGLDDSVTAVLITSPLSGASSP